MTRVYLYSDQPILAKGLEAVLTATGRFELESSYSGIPELVEHLQADAPDILLLDLTPDVTFGVLSDIKRVIQESKLVLWVNVISTELAFQAMGLGVRGILRKTLPADLQVKCLQKVHEGELWFEKALTDSFLAAKRVVLSQREGQLITLLSHGLKNKEIASTLQISEGTVKEDAISFVILAGGGQFKITYKGKLVGEELKFNVTLGDMGDREMTAKRVK